MQINVIEYLERGALKTSAQRLAILDGDKSFSYQELVIRAQGWASAIVATSAFAYGLARMYATYRALDPRSTRVVSVFRSVDDALTWLEAEEPTAGK